MSKSDSVCTQTAFTVNIGANALFGEQGRFHSPPQADFKPHDLSDNSIPHAAPSDGMEGATESEAGGAGSGSRR